MTVETELVLAKKFEVLFPHLDERQRRLVQESVTNGRRYGVGAQEITATVRAGDGTVRVQVRDDGRHTDQPKGPAAAVTAWSACASGCNCSAAGSRRAGCPWGWQVLADVPLRAAEAKGQVRWVNIDHGDRLLTSRARCWGLQLLGVKGKI